MKFTQTFALLAVLPSASVAWRTQETKKTPEQKARASKANRRLVTGRDASGTCDIDHDLAQTKKEINVDIVAFPDEGFGLFDITLHDEPYAPKNGHKTVSGWCIDFDRPIETGSYSMDIFSAYDDDIHTDAVDKPANFPQLAWLINNVNIGDTWPAEGDCPEYTVDMDTLQGAVWKIIDDQSGSNDPDWVDWREECVSEAIAAYALEEGAGYLPDCTDENEQIPLVLVSDDKKENIEHQVLMSETLIADIEGMCICDTTERTTDDDTPKGGGGMDSCLKQSDCYSATVEPVDSSTCSGSDCEFKVCMKWSDPDGACGKDSGDTVSHVCAKDDSTCSAPTGFDSASELTDVAFGSEYCQIVGPEETVEFLWKDAGGCSAGGNYVLGAVDATCEPRTADTESCTGNGIGVECIWSIKTPACTGPEPEPEPVTTPAPVTAAPVTAAPVTAAPITAAPVTDAPVPAPTTDAPVASPVAPPAEGKVSICHATSSDKNPYELITIDESGLSGHFDNEQHDKKSGDRPDYLLSDLPVSITIDGVEGILNTAYKGGSDKMDCVFESSTPKSAPTSTPPKAPTPSSASGDPHFKTWTGAKFDYHGECDLVLIDNPSFAEGLGMKLHIRTTRVEYFSYISSIVLQIGTETLEFNNDIENFKINGAVAGPKVPRHETMLSGFHVRRDKKALSVRLDRASKAKIDFKRRKNGFPAVVVDADETDVFKGSLGMLGEWGSGLKMARDGKTEIEGDATAFALEWQVRPETDGQLFSEARFPQFPTQCTAPKKMDMNRLGMTLMREQAEKACAHWKTDIEDCIFDVMATRDILAAEEGAVVA